MQLPQQQRAAVLACYYKNSSNVVLLSIVPAESALLEKFAFL